MELPNLGRRFSLQRGPGGPLNRSPGQAQPRFQYGIHFSNAPEEACNADLEGMFSEFGACRFIRDPGSQYGWVGYETVDECNTAFAGMNANMLGMYIRKGPYEAGPMLRPPMGAVPMGPTGPMGPVMNQNVGRRAGHPMRYGPHFPQRRPHFTPVEYYSDDYYGDDYYDMPYGGGIPYGYSPYDQVGDFAVGPCVLCGVRTSYSCDRCGAFYCSQRCQSQDWSVHREECNRDMPALNFGHRHRRSQGDVRDFGERIHRQPVEGTPVDGRGDGARPSPRREEATHDDPSESDTRSNEFERFGGRSQQGDRRAGAFGRNEDRADGFNRRQSDGQRRADDDPERQRFGNVPNRRSNEDRGDNFSGDRRRPDDPNRSENGCVPRRNEGGSSFPDRRNEDDRRDEGGFCDRRAGGDRRNEDGSSDRRGDGDRRPMGERRFGGSDSRNENGSSDRRGDGDRRPMGERRFGGDDRRPGNDRRNENGSSDRRGDGERRPMGERRNENGGGSGNRERGPDRLGEDRRPPRSGDNRRTEDAPGVSFGSAKPLSPRAETIRAAVPEMKPSGAALVPNATLSSLLKKASEASNSEKALAEGVCITFKNNDLVMITNINSIKNIHVTSPTSQCGEEFKKMSEELNSHCSSTPTLDRAPAPNEIVACRFDLDGAFYRAVVKHFVPGELYDMEFCDFGNTQRSKLDKLTAIPDKFKMLPKNAMVVSLRGVEDVPVAGAVKTYFENLIANETVLKLRLDGDISQGVELVKTDGGSVNTEVAALIGKIPAGPKEKDASLGILPSAPCSSNGVAPRSPEQVLSTLLTKVKVADSPAPKSTYPAEEGVCISLTNNDTVMITTSSSTGCTYIAPPPTECLDFLELTAALELHCKTAPPLGRAPREKEIVACLFKTDKCYYRAILEEVLPDGCFSMLFCDFGNVEACQSDEMKAVPDDLKILPRNAVKVYFKDVDSAPATGRIAEVLEKLTDEEMHLKLRFEGSIENGVVLLRPDGSSVNDDLRKILALQGPGPAKPAPPAQPAPAEKSRVVTEDEDDFEPSDSIPLPTSEEFPLLVFTLIEGTPYLLAGCNAQAPEVAAFEREYGHLITAYCTSKPNEVHEPASGQMCIAMFEGEWYRALTMEVLDQGTRRVFFVDYGNTSVVEPKDIRKITPELRTPLHVVTLCKVKVPGVPETDANWEIIRTSIQSRLDDTQLIVYKGVTATSTSGGSADVIIPDINALF